MMRKESLRSSRQLETTMRLAPRSNHSSAIGCFLWALVLVVGGLPSSVDAFQTSPVTRISLLRLDTTFLLKGSSSESSETLSEHSDRESKYRWSERLRLRDATEAYSAPVEELARKLSSLVSDLAKGSYSKTLGQLSANSVAMVSNKLRQSSSAAATLLADYAKESCTFMGQCSAATVAASKNLCQTSWWASPMFACLIPVYHALVLQQNPSMPHWWRVFPMDHLWASPDAIAIVGFFLLSNLAYFLSAAYLIAMFPPVLASASTAATTSTGAGAAGAAAAAVEESEAKTGRLQTMLSLRPTRHTGLGLWVATAGAVSTLFHSFQALGDYGIAEGLCYIDHGVALTAIFYFWRVLGRPSPATCYVSVAGLITLVLTHPGYAYLHSTWHFLSATAAILWATQSPGQQQQQQEDPNPRAQPLVVVAVSKSYEL
jgi:hypothetical protein